MKSSRLIVVALALSAGCIFEGCTNVPAPGKIGITFNGGTSYHIDQGQSVSLDLSLTNNPTGEGVTWSCASTTNSCPNPAFTSQNAFMAVFGASASTGTATVTATSIKQPSDSASATITISPGLSITTSSLAAATVNTAYSQTLTEVGGVAPFTWTVISGSLPAGLSLGPATGAITGNASGPSSATPVAFTVKLTDSSSPALTVDSSLSILVKANSLTPLSLLPTPGALPNATIGTTYTQVFTASNGIAPYAFSIVNGSLPAGLTSVASSATLTVSGMATAGCSACGFSVRVSDSSTPTPQTITNNYTLTVTGSSSQLCGSGSESLLSGQYAMVLKGFDNGALTGETSPEPALVGAVLYIDGAGNVNAGTTDINSNGTGTSEYGVTGTYSIGSDHRGCMSLTTTQGTEHYYFALGSISGSPAVAATAHMVESDATGPFVSGDLLEQDPTAFTSSSVTGNYAFSLSSPQNTVNAGGGKMAAVGVMDLSGGNVTGGTMDLNAAGVLDGSSAASWSTATPIAIPSGGTYNINSSNGAGSLTFSVTVNSVPNSLQLIIYVVSANHVLVMSGTDQSQAGALFGAGEALLQANSTFASTALNGTSVLATSSLPSGNAAAFVGTMTTTSAGSYNLFGWKNTGSAIQNETSTNANGTLQIATDGRVTLASGTGNLPVFWLVGNNEGFFLGSGSDVETGFFQLQTATSLTTGTPYAFGTVNPQAPDVDQGTGVTTFTGSNVSGTTDSSASGTILQGAPFGPLAYSVNGTGLGSAGSSAGCTVGTIGSAGCQFVFYVISPTTAVQLTLLNSGNQLIRLPSVQTATQ